MNEETIKEIFIAVAFRAMEEGKELRLEKGKNTSTSKALGGGLMDNSIDFDSLVLTVTQSEPELPSVQDEEDAEDEDDETGRTD